MAKIVGYIPPKKNKAPSRPAKGNKKPPLTDDPAAPAPDKEPPKEA